MNIDLHTLAFVLSLTILLQVVALFTQFRINKTYHGPGWWTLGNVSWSLGFAFNYLRDFSGIGPVAIVANNALFITGLALYYVGVLRFFDRREKRGWLVALCAATTLAAIYFTYIHIDLLVRRVNISAALALISFLIARDLLKYRVRQVDVSAKFLAMVFLLNCVFFAIRVVFAMLGADAGDLFTATLIETATYLVVLIFSTLWTLGFILMINQRLSEESREVRENLRQIFNTNPDAILITRRQDGTFIDVNDSFTALTGFTRADVIGESTLSIHVWKNPADRQNLVAALDEKGYCDNLEAVLQRKDGSQFSGMVSAKYFALQGVPHIISVTRDITDRKQMEAALQESEEKYRFMTENSSDVIWHMDQNYRFDYVSPADERLRGFTRDEVIGTTVWSLLKPEGIEHVRQVNAKRLADEQAGVRTGTIRYELEQICKDGGWIWTEINVTAHRDRNGELTGYHGVTRDITESKRLQEELQEQATTDELTGVTNRRHFLALASAELKRALRLKHPLVIALIDIDHFKSINDAHGHIAGDQALLMFTKICQKNIREIDVFARIGGDEFALLLPEASSGQAFVMVERMRLTLMAQVMDQAGTQVSITISSGIAALADDQEPLDTLLRRADLALYRAKESGRNRVVVEESSRPAG
jgi:diguanylate cyclase (GGDEF)-like protein/PAS domain S-box-containing protein